MAKPSWLKTARPAGRAFASLEKSDIAGIPSTDTTGSFLGATIYEFGDSNARWLELSPNQFIALPYMGILIVISLLLGVRE